MQWISTDQLKFHALRGNLALLERCVPANGVELQGSILGVGKQAESNLSSNNKTPPTHCGNSDQPAGAADNPSYHAYSLYAPAPQVLTTCAANAYKRERLLREWDEPWSPFCGNNPLKFRCLTRPFGLFVFPHSVTQNHKILLIILTLAKSQNPCGLLYSM